MTEHTPTTEDVRKKYAVADLLEYNLSKPFELAEGYAEFDRWLREHDAKVLWEAADRLRDAARHAADAQREHDIAEGLPVIGTSTANEVEWHQMGNWAWAELLTLAAEREVEHMDSTHVADMQARAALSPEDYAKYTGGEA